MTTKSFPPRSPRQCALRGGRHRASIGTVAFFSLLTFLLPCPLGHGFDYGQTGGGPLAGSLTVTVVDGETGLPMGGAWVLVGPEANNPFAGNFGRTEETTGQIAFTNAALSGPQTVTVTGPAEGWRVFTLAKVNAAAITVPLEPFTIYDPAYPPVEDGIMVQGTVSNFNVANDGNVRVGIARDPVDIEWMMDFDIERLFGPALTFTMSGYGTFDLPRNLYWPAQTTGGVSFPARSPYKLRLEAGEYTNVFCLRGRVPVTTLITAFTSGSMGALLGALAYDRYGLTPDTNPPTEFQVVGPGPMTKDVNLTYLMYSFFDNPFYGVYFNVSNVPEAGYSWPGDYTRQTFLFALEDLSPATGSGPLTILQMMKKNAAWSGGTNQIVHIPQTGNPRQPPPGTILGMAVASAFDADSGPDSRVGVSATISRQGLVPALSNATPGPGTSTLDGFLPFLDYAAVEPPLGGRILRFLWYLVEGADYVRCDLDVVAYAACVPGPTGEEECPVGRQREYRSTNWTLLLPAGETVFQLPALPPGAPRPLWVPAPVTGVNYTADWKVSVYGLRNGALFDFNSFSFETHRDRVTETTQRSLYFNVPDRNPDPPWNLSPANGEPGVSLMPALESSAFSDQDAQSTHAASQWQVRANGGSYATPVYDSGETSAHLTSITLPSALPAPGTYWWHARHQDDSGRWSAYSAESSFVAGGCAADADCDDQDGCTADHCNQAGSFCEHQCLAKNPADPCCASPGCSQSPACRVRTMPWLNLLLD